MSKITLKIDLHEYKALIQKLHQTKDMIYKLYINELIKHSLIKDLNAVRFVLEKSEETTEQKEVGQ